MNLPTSEPDRVLQDESKKGRQDDEPDASRAKSMKFVYPSGARPLEGYTIKRGVGRGGFGEVYFATSDAGKEVALKLIRRNLDVELRGVRHCLNLKHPNLIGLYDIRTDSHQDQWVVMEYVSGQSLEDAIDANPGGLPVEDVLFWIKEIAAGVAYLHDHGIVHRDLKPGNIFLDHDLIPGGRGVVKIGDYGLSKFLSCSRRSGQTESVGTVHYMAPEIANGRYGREIDTYALGIILYEMLTGHVPFEGESVGEVLMKHLTAEPDLSRVEEPFREIIQRALAKDPELRLGSVSELVAMLPGEGPSQPQPAPAEKPPRHEPKPPSEGSEQYSGYDDVSTSHRAMRPAHDIEEPIFATVRNALRGMKRAVTNSDLPPVVQGALIVGGVIVVLATGKLWLLLFAIFAIPGSLAYCAYYVFWSLLVKPGIRSHRRRADERHGRLTPYTLHTEPDGDQHVANTASRRRPWREIVQSQLAEKSIRQRVTQLLGSMFISGVVCVLLSALAAMLVGGAGESWASFNLWLAVVSTFGCWAVLFANAWTEGRVEDHTPMRASLLAMGAVLGLVAFGLTDAVSLNLPHESSSYGPPPQATVLGMMSPAQHSMSDDYTAPTVQPPLAVSAIYFALLFALPRWQRLADYTRGHRLNPWSVMGLMLWAWLLHMVWWYPQPVGIALAAIIGIATQISSPWFPPSKRVELARTGKTA